MAGAPRCAVGVPNVGPFSDPSLVVELAVAAEEHGWDGFFVWDHQLWRDPRWDVADPVVVIAAVAARTARIRVGILVNVLARRRVGKVARESVTLDLLSGGRLVVGAGLGRWPLSSPRSASPVTLREWAARLDESLHVLAALWSGEPVTVRGEYLTAADVTMLPRPVQRPRIPIWCGGRWPDKAPFRRAARWDGVMPTHVSYGLGGNHAAGRAAGGHPVHARTPYRRRAFRCGAGGAHRRRHAGPRCHACNAISGGRADLVDRSPGLVARHTCRRDDPHPPGAAAADSSLAWATADNRRPGCVSSCPKDHLPAAGSRPRWPNAPHVPAAMDGRRLIGDCRLWCRRSGRSAHGNAAVLAIRGSFGKVIAAHIRCWRQGVRSSPASNQAASRLPVLPGESVRRHLGYPACRARLSPWWGRRSPMQVMHVLSRSRAARLAV